MKERKGDEVGDGSKMVEPGVAWAGAQAFSGITCFRRWMNFTASSEVCPPNIS